MLNKKQVADLIEKFSQYSELESDDSKRYKVKYFYWYERIKKEHRGIPTKMEWDGYRAAFNKNEKEDSFKKNITGRCPTASACSVSFDSWNNFISVAEKVLFGNKREYLDLHIRARRPLDAELISPQELVKQIVSDLNGPPSRESWQLALRQLEAKKKNGL